MNLQEMTQEYSLGSIHEIEIAIEYEPSQNILKTETRKAEVVGSAIQQRSIKGQNYTVFCVAFCDVENGTVYSLDYSVN